MAKVTFKYKRHATMSVFDFIKGQLNAENYDVGELEEIKHNIENIQNMLASLINQLSESNLLSERDLQAIVDSVDNYHGIGYVYADIEEIVKEDSHE